MSDCMSFFMGGRWVDPSGTGRLPIVNPATDTVVGQVALADASDVDRAVTKAASAFPAFARTSVAERRALLERIVAVYQTRMPELAAAMTTEMGAPHGFALSLQAAVGLGHLAQAVAELKTWQPLMIQGTTAIVREPVGVCALITPWNWPMNQICAKVAAALAAGCTMVLKPSELAPLSATLFARIMEEAGVPAGVFNLIHGSGEEAGAALCAHPLVDMVSFTGSQRGGVAAAIAAAPTVKRVTQELGGKSASIVLDDADLDAVIPGAVQACFLNSGQSCNAPTRLLVPAVWHDRAAALAAATAEAIIVGDPLSDGTSLGPLANERQFNRVQALIRQGVAEGARLMAGGPGRPAGLDRGCYARPTIFADVRPDMTIAREEIFGPVLSIIPYGDEEDAIRIANDTIYGLSAHVHSVSIDRARAVAGRLRTGNVHINGAWPDIAAPFGGYKQSGNGREWGLHGILDYTEMKSVFGYQSS